MLKLTKNFKNYFSLMYVKSKTHTNFKKNFMPSSLIYSQQNLHLKFLDQSFYKLKTKGFNSYTYPYLLEDQEFTTYFFKYFFIFMFLFLLFLNEYVDQVDDSFYDILPCILNLFQWGNLDSFFKEEFKKFF